MFLGVWVCGRRWEGIGLPSKSLSEGFMLVSREEVCACVSMCRVFTWCMCVFIHVFGSSTMLPVICRQPATWLWSDLIETRKEAVVKGLAAGWVSFKCQKEKGRKINGFSEIYAFLQLPLTWRLGRGLLTDWGLPGTGRVFLGPFCWWVWHALWTGHWVMEWQGQRFAFGWPLWTARVFIAVSVASLRRPAANEKALKDCQWVLTPSSSPYLMCTWK